MYLNKKYKIAYPLIFYFTVKNKNNNNNNKMAAPALKDLPKVAENLKSQLESFNTDKLKNANTQEKIILPTAEGLCIKSGLLKKKKKKIDK